MMDMDRKSFVDDIFSLIESHCGAAEEAPAAAAEKFVIIVGVDPKDRSAGYGVMLAESYKKWEAGEIGGSDLPDRFSLLYGGCDMVDTFDTWHAATLNVADCEGEISDVLACVAY